MSPQIPANHIVNDGNYATASAKIWSNDDKIHFLLLLDDTLKKERKNVLYIEDGTAVKTFMSATYTSSNDYYTSAHIFMYESGEKNYLKEELRIIDQETDEASYVVNIYSVDIPTATAPQQKKSASHRPYPYPTQQEITLPYMLKSGKDADLIIYNIQGQEVERKRVSGDYDKIRLNVSRYRSGTYIYDCDGVKSKFVVRH